jgi:hypothetical protein
MNLEDGNLPMTDMDVDVLRILNGEDVHGYVWGAAIAVTLEYLKGRGYAHGCYEITEKGKRALQALEDYKATKAKGENK